MAVGYLISPVKIGNGADERLAEIASSFPLPLPGSNPLTEGDLVGRIVAGIDCGLAPVFEGEPAHIPMVLISNNGNSSQGYRWMYIDRKALDFLNSCIQLIPTIICGHCSQQVYRDREWFLPEAFY